MKTATVKISIMLEFNNTIEEDRDMYINVITKTILIIVFSLTFSCNNNEWADKEYDSSTKKEVYDICHKSITYAFNEMSEKMFENTNVEDICGYASAYKDKELVKICEKACRDAYKEVKDKAR